jgi:hypothetical protein
MQMKKIFLLFGLLTSYTILQAQTPQRTCGTVAHTADLIADNPDYQTQIDAINQQAANYAANGKKTRTLVTIPVVFHVVYNTPAQNIPDTLIFEQLKQLNLDFAHLNSDSNNTPIPFRPLAANTDVQFCLAVRDPQGNASTGITRTSSTVTSFSTNNNIKYTANGGKDAWPRDKYLNIWIGNLGNGLLGYAQFPGGGAATDGVVCLTTSIGSMAYPNTATSATPYDLGRTATHEVGHWLSLYHIWGDDGGACTGSDQVNDTPNSEDANYNCPTYPLLDACATVSPGAMFMNYMDYVDDNCMNMFTQGQGTRIASLFAAGGFRAPLLTSDGCQSVQPCAGVPNAGSISTSNDTLCSGSKTLTVSGATSATGISYQWQSAPSAAGLWVNAAGSNTNYNYIAQSNGGVQYFRCIVICNNSTLKDTTAAIAIYSYGVGSVTGATNLCQAGNTTLTAVGVSTGAYNWYTSATATTPAFTGNPYTAAIASNTTLYVNTGTINKYSVGPANYNIGTNSVSTSNTWKTNGLIFKTFGNNVTIDTVFVYPSGAGDVMVTVSDSLTNTTAGSYTLAVTAAQINTKVPVPVNISCGPNTTYYMRATGSTVPGLYRNSTGAMFPYTVPSVISIIKSINDQSTRYRYFYDWKISSGCSTPLVAIPITITPATLTATSTPILCNGNTASINANAGSGYSYSINGGPSNTTGSFSGLAAGLYTVTATNTASSCIVSSTFSFTNPPAITFSLNATANSAICNGSITPTVGGGIPPYQYQINGGAFVNNTNALNNLCLGQYTICVKDASACSTCSNAFVNSINSIALSTQNTKPACFAAANGSTFVNIIGGLAPYTYSVNGGPFGGSSFITGLAAGTYTITGKDVNNITNTTIVTIGTSAPIVTTVTTAAGSTSNCTGAISATTAGGVAPYTYTLNSVSQGNVSAYGNKCPGNYTICATDNNGCSACKIDSVKLVIPISISIPSKTQACAGTTSGAISALALNGTPPYQYSLNAAPYAGGNNFTALSPGVYTVSAKDVNNIVASTIVNIGLSANLAVTVSKTNPTCFGQCSGSISAIATTGVPGYSYSIQNGIFQNAANFSAICAGSYTIVAKDANNCTITNAIDLIAPDPLTTTMLINNISCNGNGDGNVTVNAYGGSGNYVYKIGSGAYTPNNIFTGLAQGTYSIYSKDNNGCIQVLPASISNPSSLTATANTNVASHSITTLAAGGTPPYKYSINNGVATQNPNFTNLAGGVYTVTVIDANGCNQTIIVNLEAPAGVQTFLLENNISIYPNPANGKVNIEINAGAGAENLQILLIDNLGKVVRKELVLLNGTTVQTIDISGIASGTYTVFMVDNHNAAIAKKLVIQ